MSRKILEKIRQPRSLAAVVALLGAATVGPWAAWGQYQQALKSATSAAPRFELFDPHFAASPEINTRSPGLAIAAYLNGLQTGQTSENAVTNRGRDLNTSIVLPDGAMAFLGVESTRSQRTSTGDLIPSSEDAVAVTVGQDNVNGSRRMITFSRDNDGHNGKWSMTDITESSRSGIQQTTVVSPNSIGIFDMVTTFDSRNGLVLGEPLNSHNANAALAEYNRAAGLATAIAGKAFYGTMAPEFAFVN